MRSSIGRIAMRVEGRWWVAYYAMPDTMDGAIELGRVQMAIVKDPVRKQTFIGLFKSAFEDIFKDKLEVERWTEHPAPESEKSGSA